jgi:outer membrane receptor for ferrienterochelin and colicin
MISESIRNMIKRITICLLFSILWAFPIKSQASNIVVELAQMSIEELMRVTVSCVGFFDLPPEQVPGSIQIITTQQLENSPATALADMLDLYVSGIHVGNGNTNGASYAVRGMRMPDNSTTVFMFNGQNVNSAAGLGFNMNLDLPLMGDISQLEVIKGPCALVHGSGAMNGFVNIVPKNGSDHPGAYWNFQYGLKEKLAKMEQAYGLSYGNDNDIFVYFGFVDSKGFTSQETYGFNTSMKNKSTSRTPHCRFFKNTYRMSVNWNHNNFHLTSFVLHDRGSSNAMYSFLKNSMEYYQGSFFSNLSWESQITPYEKLECNVPLMIGDLGLIGEDIELKRESEEGGSEAYLGYRLILKTHRLPNHAIAIGGMLGKRHFYAGKYYLDNDPDSDGRLLDSDWHEIGFFYEDIFHLSQNWIALFGFRHDIIENEDFNLPAFINENPRQNDEFEQECKEVSTFRLATSYKLSPDDTVKLSFQEGYHQTNMFNYYEVFYGSTYLQDDMEFELMQSLEFNYKHVEPEYGLQISTNLFFNSYENSLLINTNMNKDVNKNVNKNVYSEDNQNFLLDELFGNGPDFASIGGEIEMDWDINSQSHINLSYAYTRPEEIDEDKNTKLSVANQDCTQWLTYPTHIIKGTIHHKTFNDRLSLSLHASYHSAIDAPSKFKSPQYYPPTLKAHASASFQMTDQLTFQLIGRNIFDNDHPPVGFHYHEPWEGNLGEGSPLVYMSLTWKE